MAARYPRNRAASRNNSARESPHAIVASGIILPASGPVFLISINSPRLTRPALPALMIEPRAYSNRSTSRSEGNNFIHSSATMMVPMPPSAAAGTAPSKNAAMPLSNSPS
jgi:hypothetical protein